MISNTKKILIIILALAFTASCSNEYNDHYFPLSKGITWFYDVEQLTMTEPIYYRMIFSSLGRKKLDDKKFFVRRMHNDVFQYFSIEDSGVVQHLINQDGDFIEQKHLYKYPLEENSQWTASGDPFLMRRSIDEINAQQNSMPGLSQDSPLEMHYTIQSLNETVKVPAGKFKNCMKIVGEGSCSFSSVGSFARKMIVEVTNTDWYCPDVGLVKVERRESSERVSLKPVHYVIQLHSIKQ